MFKNKLNNLIEKAECLVFAFNTNKVSVIFRPLPEFKVSNIGLFEEPEEEFKLLKTNLKYIVKESNSEKISDRISKITLLDFERDISKSRFKSVNKVWHRDDDSIREQLNRIQRKNINKIEELNEDISNAKERHQVVMRKLNEHMANDKCSFHGYALTSSFLSDPIGKYPPVLAVGHILNPDEIDIQHALVKPIEKSNGYHQHQIDSHGIDDIIGYKVGECEFVCDLSKIKDRDRQFYKKNKILDGREGFYSINDGKEIMERVHQYRVNNNIGYSTQIMFMPKSTFSKSISAVCLDMRLMTCCMEINGQHDIINVLNNYIKIHGDFYDSLFVNKEYKEIKGLDKMLHLDVSSSPVTSPNALKRRKEVLSHVYAEFLPVRWYADLLANAVRHNCPVIAVYATENGDRAMLLTNKKHLRAG